MSILSLSAPLKLTPALKPSAMLFEPVCNGLSAPTPIPSFLPPVVLDARAPPPTALLYVPVVFNVSACSPSTSLLKPVVLNRSENPPTAVLLAPVFTSSAVSPRATLLDPVAVPSWPLLSTNTTAPPLIVVPPIPAMKVLLCVPLLPTRIVFDSAATPWFPMSMLDVPVVRLKPAPVQTAIFSEPVLDWSACLPSATL